MKKNLLWLLVVVMTCAVVACKSDKKPAEGPQPTAFEEAMTAQDSTEVANLVDRFFGYMKQGDVPSAVEMLYTIKGETQRDEPQPLTNEEIEKQTQILQMFPVVDYKIEYMKFDQSFRNEVMCSVVMQKGENGAPDVTTKFFFKPVNWVGTWCLCMINSNTGDNPVLEPEQRDSVTREYKKEVRLREAVEESGDKQ